MFANIDTTAVVGLVPTPYHITHAGERRRAYNETVRNALARLLTEDGYQGFERTGSGWQYIFPSAAQQ